MNTHQFLKHVLPKAGTKILGIDKSFEKDGEVHKYQQYIDYPSVEVMASQAEKLSSKGETVFFGVNSFNGWFPNPKGGKPRIRAQQNIAKCRSLFDDFDVYKEGETDPDGTRRKKYETRADALADVKLLAKTLGIVPTITSSGGGFHSYITATEDYDKDEWDELAAMKRAVCKHLELKVDYAVCADAARILRPVGTLNRKYEPPRPVSIGLTGKHYPLEVIRERLTAYTTENQVTVQHRPSGMANPFAAAFGDFPPSDANTVADHCNIIGMFRESKGDMGEVEWYNALGVVSMCEGGEPLCHEWSKGHPDYSERQTQEKIDQWADLKPTTCFKFDEVCGCRESCKAPERTKSPITLGFLEVAPSDEAPTEVKETEAEKAAQGATIEGRHIPYWPDKGVRWSGGVMSKSMMDADGIVHWVPFCRSFVYPVNRIRDADGVWNILWEAKEKNGKWREFIMPTSELASLDLMAKTFASNEVFLHKTKNARRDMAEFCEGMIEKLQAWSWETKTYDQLGWSESLESFVLGTTQITPKGEAEVLCSKSVVSDAAKNFGVEGTLDQWVDNMETYLNRPNAEIEQFMLCHTMGSPLIEVMGFDSWHGMPLGLIGEGGTGKTTAAKMALTFYGNVNRMSMQAHTEGATLGAAITQISSTGCVPVLLDEFSGRPPEEFSRMGYALGNGMDKKRLKPDGSLASDGVVWFKNSLVTSNNSIHDEISKLPTGYKVEATQLRFFEIPMGSNRVKNVFGDMYGTSFTDNHISSNYGTACRPFLKFVMEHRESVKRQLIAARDKLNPIATEDSAERFYRDTVVTAYVAGKIASKLGLISFNVEDMLKKTIGFIKNMRESRKASKVELPEYVAQFIATLPGRLITTQHFADSRTNKKEVPIEMIRGAIVGRVAYEDERMFVSVKAVNDWCKDNNITGKAMRDTFDALGYLVMGQDGSPSTKMYLGAGTTMPSGQARCYELKYDLLFGDEAMLQIVKDIDGNPTEVKA